MPSPGSSVYNLQCGLIPMSCGNTAFAKISCTVSDRDALLPVHDAYLCCQN